MASTYLGLLFRVDLTGREETDSLADGNGDETEPVSVDDLKFAPWMVPRPTGIEVS